MNVSVIVPAHNASGTIGMMLESLATERQVIREIVLVDDSSSDGTSDLANGKARDLGLPLRVVRTECRDSGEARNAGIGYVTGDWIYFIDADDQHLTGGLRRLVEAGGSKPGVDMVVGAYRRLVDGMRRRDKRPMQFGVDSLRNAENYISGKIRSMAVGSVLVRASIVRDARFPSGLPYDEDTIFWAQLLSRASVVSIPAMTMVYRLSTKRADGRFLTDPSRRFETWRRQIRLLSEIGLSRESISAREGIVALKIARVHYAKQDWPTANKFLDIARHCARSRSNRYRAWRYGLKLALRRQLPDRLPNG